MPLQTVRTHTHTEKMHTHTQGQSVNNPEVNILDLSLSVAFEDSEAGEEKENQT